MTFFTPQSSPPALALPRLEVEPPDTQSDLRQIQHWSTWVPRTLYQVNVGTTPPAFIEPLSLNFTFVGAPSTGVLNIPVTGFSYGYNTDVSPGDSASALGMVVVQLAGCTLTQLQVVCYTHAGAAINGTNVRVNYRLIGA